MNDNRRFEVTAKFIADNFKPCNVTGVMGEQRKEITICLILMW